MHNPKWANTLETAYEQTLGFLLGCNAQFSPVNMFARIMNTNLECIDLKQFVNQPYDANHAKYAATRDLACTRTSSCREDGDAARFE